MGNQGAERDQGAGAGHRPCRLGSLRRPCVGPSPVTGSTHLQDPQVPLGVEPSSPRLRAHAAAQDDGIVAHRAERVGELLQMRGPVSEDEAVPALGKRGRRVGDDLPGPLLVGDQVLVNDEGQRAVRAGSRL